MFSESLLAKFKVFSMLLLACWLVTGPSHQLLLAVSSLILLLCAFDTKKRRSYLKILKKLSFFFAIVTLSHSFYNPSSDIGAALRVPLGFGYSLTLYLGGFFGGLEAAARIAMVVLYGGWVRNTSSMEAVAEAFHSIFRVKWLSAVLLKCLELIDGQGGHGRKKKSDGKHRDGGKEADATGPEKEKLSFKKIRVMTLNATESLVTGAHKKLNQSRSDGVLDRFGQSADINIITVCCLAIMATKAFTILPGLPISPGHKNLIIVPIFLYAAAATNSRFGGAKVGLAAGVLNFLLGYGKYGPLEVMQFFIPGLLADLMLPLVRRAPEKGLLSLLALGVMGGILGAGRFTGNALAVLIAGAPITLILVMLPALASQVFFGFLGSFLGSKKMIELGAKYRESEVEESA
ncbi:MAG: hypothetical protein ACJA09_003278 [Alcanivorax sp.]|jgi:hypothetical protein